MGHGDTGCFPPSRKTSPEAISRSPLSWWASTLTLEHFCCCLFRKNITLLSQHCSEKIVGVANSCYLLQTFDIKHIKLALQLCRWCLIPTQPSSTLPLATQWESCLVSSHLHTWAGHPDVWPHLPHSRPELEFSLQLATVRAQCF